MTVLQTSRKVGWGWEPADLERETVCVGISHHPQYILFKLVVLFLSFRKAKPKKYRQPAWRGALWEGVIDTTSLGWVEWGACWRHLYGSSKSPVPSPHSLLSRKLDKVERRESRMRGLRTSLPSDFPPLPLESQFYLRLELPLLNLNVLFLLRQSFSICMSYLV